tara:strand:+ start:1777 stop:2313 length:537 start_codon:yes stop_codon:yes gene_type:complete
MRDQLLKILQEKAYRKGEFKLSSGKTSGHYLNCKPVILSGEGLSLVSQLMLCHIEEDAASVGGLTLGADPLVCGVSLAAWNLQERILNALIVRKEPKGHGTGAWIEGPLPLQGQPVTVLEDVVSSGNSSLKAVRKLRDAGYEVNRIVAIVDRKEHDPFTFYDAGVELRSLYTINDFHE